ncbi:hypothetical protein AVEN_91096-1 [Araneus ventricosus]|uniref:PiggyBac transposable element-derived protein domain-containing protein n=1 Tax=Araneus ventricosus TaxID=182803 RepID=A0A4Y2JDM5_ARAVE|nr:hypothetical protein AVEN_91096-1 [Araneus ventricosus]
MVDKWQNEWIEDDNGRDIYILIPRVKMWIEKWRKEEIIFTGTRPFPTYLYRFNLTTSEFCSCGADIVHSERESEEEGAVEDGMESPPGNSTSQKSSIWWRRKILKSKSINAAGTVRLNRFSKPPLSSDKECRTKGTGISQEITSSDGYVALVKWVDNRSVVLTSNFLGINKEDEDQLWSKESKSFITVKMP